MHRIIYVSQASNPMTDDDLYNLALDSIQRNEKCCISGFLTYRDGRFLQYLEGSDVALAKLWSSIQRDPRHQVSQFWRYQSEHHRILPDWHMRLLEGKPGDELYTIFSRMFEAIIPPVAPGVNDLLDALVEEIARCSPTAFHPPKT